jgi:putative ABC transport system substrate-binding protein
MGRVTGKIAARVLQGEDPVNIPTVFMTDPNDVDLLLNMDVAKKLGLTFPADVVAKANTIIEHGNVTKK